MALLLYKRLCTTSQKDFLICEFNGDKVDKCWHTLLPENIKVYMKNYVYIGN